MQFFWTILWIVEAILTVYTAEQIQIILGFMVYVCIPYKVMFLGKNFGDKKLWWIGTQDMFGRETIGTLSLYAEGNQKVGR